MPGECQGSTGEDDRAMPTTPKRQLSAEGCDSPSF